jgi:hypothetical protein
MNAFLETVHFQGGYAVVSENETRYERAISVDLDRARPQIEIKHWNRMKREYAHKAVKPTEESYLAWLRVLFAVRAEDEIESAIATAASLSGYPLEAKNVRIRAIELG